jgi:hypothetical protein
MFYSFQMCAEKSKANIRLSDVLEASAGLSAWCRICNHHQLLDPKHLMGQLGPAIRLAEAAARLRCQACGARQAELRPHYPGLGVVAGHRRRADK